MPNKNGSKVELVGKVYRIVESRTENQKVKPGYMSMRLLDGDRVVCLESKGPWYLYVLLQVFDDGGIEVYPKAFEFLSKPLGVLDYELTEDDFFSLRSHRTIHSLSHFFRTPSHVMHQA